MSCIQRHVNEFVDGKIIHKNLDMNNLININDSYDTTNALILNFKQA